MRVRISLLVVFLVAFGVADGAQQTPPKSDGTLPAFTIQDIMDTMIDPSADYLWDSVSIVIDANGPKQRAPRTDAEWSAVRLRAVMLIESANLLLVPGRRVAKPGAKSKNPNIELSPEEIEKVIAENPEAWNDLARRMQSAVTPMIAAIDARNPDRLAALGGNLDHACESCHLKFWYPNEAKPGPPVPSR